MLLPCSGAGDEAALSNNQSEIGSPRKKKSHQELPEALMPTASESGRRVPCNPIGRLWSDRTGEVKTAYCKSWCCPRCAPRRKKRWVMRCSTAPAFHCFVTLTLPGSGQPDKANFARLQRGWTAVRQVLKRRQLLAGYVWVREQGERRSKRLHMHLILRLTHLPKDKRFAVSLEVLLEMRAAYDAALDHEKCWMKVERIRKSHAAGLYCSKYLSKQLSRPWPRYVRRIQSTDPPPVPEPGWHFDKAVPAAFDREQSQVPIRWELNDRATNESLENRYIQEEKALGRHPTLWLYLTRREKLIQSQIRHAEVSYDSRITG